MPTPIPTEKIGAELVSSDEHGKERFRIVTEGLSVYFDGKAAIRDISLAIRTNRVTAIIGPSGCGKSTFLRALNRLHELQPNARVEAYPLGWRGYHGARCDAGTAANWHGLPETQSLPGDEHF